MRPMMLPVLASACKGHRVACTHGANLGKRPTLHGAGQQVCQHAPRHNTHFVSSFSILNVVI